MKGFKLILILLMTAITLSSCSREQSARESREARLAQQEMLFKIQAQERAKIDSIRADSIKRSLEVPHEVFEAVLYDNKSEFRVVGSVIEIATFAEVLRPDSVRIMRTVVTGKKYSNP